MSKIPQESYTKILIILFIISLGSFIFSILPQEKKPVELIKNTNTIITQNLPIQKVVAIQKNQQVIDSPTITLIAGDLNAKLKFTEGQTLYQILMDSENIKLVNMLGKEYTGIGFFVTDIGDLHEERGKYLMYYVNGIEASLGISTYIPKINDVIEWKLN